MSQVPIESKFQEMLVDNLNAELVLGTVTNVKVGRAPFIGGAWGLPSVACCGRVGVVRGIQAAFRNCSTLLNVGAHRGAWPCW